MSSDISMRILFMATGDIALPSFRHLLSHGPRPVAVVTQPDKPVGRHLVLTAPQIKVEAEQEGIPVYQPEKVGDIADELAALEPDVVVVMAYGQILKKSVLSLGKLGIINLHASLLPKYRGAACIQAAIDAGDDESGITVIHVVKRLDAGDMIVAKSIPITPDETGGTLHDKLADLAPSALSDALEILAQGSDIRTPQDEDASTYISKLEREAGKIDWQMDATAIERRIRAYDPWPGTFTLATEGGVSKRLKIFPPSEVRDLKLEPGEILIEDGELLVGCGSGALCLQNVQPDGGKRMKVSDYLRGKKPEKFGDS